MKQLNGHRNREGWRTIQNRLKQKGCDRTIEQIKNRHRSIRQTYVRVKDNNRRTGASPATSQFHVRKTSSLNEDMSCSKNVELRGCFQIERSCRVIEFKQRKNNKMSNERCFDLLYLHGTMSLRRLINE